MNKLTTILSDVYEVGPLAAPTIAVLWAAERLCEAEGSDVAKQELSALNRLREKRGRMPAYAPYGSPLF